MLSLQANVKRTGSRLIACYDAGGEVALEMRHIPHATLDITDGHISLARFMKQSADRNFITRESEYEYGEVNIGRKGKAAMGVYVPPRLIHLHTKAQG